MSTCYPPGLTVEPLTPHIGARVTGISLGTGFGNGSGNGFDPVSVDAIRQALNEHLVLVFDDQRLDARQLRNVVAQFGPLFDHHSDEGVLRDSDVPEVLQMLKEPDGTRLFGGSDWHADVTFRRPGAYLSVLHAKQLPPVGGDTLFASGIAAFAGLSPGMQSMLRNLQAVHSYSGRGQPDHPSETAIHPVIRKHPTRDVDSLFINRMFAVRFVDMSSRESEPIIDYLDRHMSRPEFTFRHRWQDNQVVMWDNRFTLHYPSNDFVGHRRLLLRCTAMEAA